MAIAPRVVNILPDPAEMKAVNSAVGQLWYEQKSLGIYLWDGNRWEPVDPNTTYPTAPESAVEPSEGRVESDPFPWRIGDRITRGHNCGPLRITAIGDMSFLAADTDGIECRYIKNAGWVEAAVRLTVERRLPRKGERYIAQRGNFDEIEVALHDHSGDSRYEHSRYKRWVVVDG